MSRIARRTFAKHVGLAALLSPFLASLSDRSASAQVTGRAKYLCLFVTPGTSSRDWTPAAGSSETRIAFTPMNEPLSVIKDSLVIVEGLDSFGTAGTHGSPGGLCAKGYSDFGHVSIEQFVSDRLAESGERTSIPNLVLGGHPGQMRSTFFRSGMALAPIASPVAAFDTIFAGATTPPATMPSDLLRRRRSVLDVLRGEIGALSGQLGASERYRLELHLDSIRQLEERLAASEMEPGGGGCRPPASPVDSSEILLQNAACLDLAVDAMACDLTRVVAVEFGNNNGTQIAIPEIGNGDWHSGFIHSGLIPELTRVERWLAQRFAGAVTRSKSLAAPDGRGTLFDQTLFVWARDMGDAPSHTGNDMRFVFAGGAGGALRTSPEGRYVVGRGEAHQRALLSCATAMGISNLEGFGRTNFGGNSRLPLDGIGA
ncbi:DUF1552 domain-containing protein [Sandaracinus amylolyticus]|uniref:DUF1552 domain-containing protein n=1 Tax=Sandaracinus amylolyticus TaxID=927083 RepID=UPI001F18C24A|nr:DUF1552 domain-containing protein [Sandaracinus amylolyticus]UJR78172.1 Hypothetical protein I5071_1990 [Sandaracinus amylolyticus]